MNGFDRTGSPASVASSSSGACSPLMNRNRGAPSGVSAPASWRYRSKPFMPANAGVADDDVRALSRARAPSPTPRLRLLTLRSPSSPAAARSASASARRSSTTSARTPAPAGPCAGDRRLARRPAASAETARPTGESTSASSPPCADAIPSEIESPRPGALTDFARREERLEDPPAQLRTDSRAAVGHLDRLHRRPHHEVSTVIVPLLPDDDVIACSALSSRFRITWRISSRLTATGSGVRRTLRRTRSMLICCR